MRKAFTLVLLTLKPLKQETEEGTLEMALGRPMTEILSLLIWIIRQYCIHVRGCSGGSVLDYTITNEKQLDGDWDGEWFAAISENEETGIQILYSLEYGTDE